VTKCDPTPFPSSCGSEPAPCGSEPGTCGFQAGTSGSEPGTCGSEPGTCGSEPGTSGYEPGTCGYEAGTCGFQAAPKRLRAARGCGGAASAVAVVRPDPGEHALTVDCLGLPERGWVQLSGRSLGRVSRQDRPTEAGPRQRTIQGQRSDRNQSVPSVVKGSRSTFASLPWPSRAFVA
jgi:hypothetical protein